jgi:hypothetical protein
MLAGIDNTALFCDIALLMSGNTRKPMQLGGISKVPPLASEKTSLFCKGMYPMGYSVVIA